MNLQAPYDLRYARAGDWPKAKSRVRLLAAEQRGERHRGGLK
jgi:hypothetical protein